MFERYTEKARQVVILAQDEARALKHNYIGGEHLLLGLLREENGIGARVLTELGVGLTGVRALIVAHVGEGDVALAGQIPFTPRSKKMLELALREALSLGHNYIGTEHILLGIVRENAGNASLILSDLGVTPQDVREGVIRMLSGPKRQTEQVDVTFEKLLAGARLSSAALNRFVSDLKQFIDQQKDKAA